jgi:hypothetical protein
MGICSLTYRGITHRKDDLKHSWMGQFYPGSKKRCQRTKNIFFLIKKKNIPPQNLSSN